LGASLDGRKLIVGIDRLDYSKGIIERLRAFEQLVRDDGKHRRSATLLQISAPSREEVPEYQSMRRSIERLVGHINGRFGEHDWTPVRYLNRTYSRRSVTGFCAISKVGLVTPLRDGLNLVAEEYVAAQPEGDPGVLVLSRFAGAAEYLDGALIVNPYDVAGVAIALDRALTMPLEERQERHARMMTAVRTYDIVAWRRRFLEALEAQELPSPRRAAA
jgi:trehalose 6-phosphate synthase